MDNDEFCGTNDSGDMDDDDDDNGDGRRCGITANEVPANVEFIYSSIGLLSYEYGYNEEYFFVRSKWRTVNKCHKYPMFLSQLRMYFYGQDKDKERKEKEMQAIERSGTDSAIAENRCELNLNLNCIELN